MKRILFISILLMLMSSVFINCRDKDDDNTALLAGAALLASQGTTAEEATVQINGVAKDSNGNVIANGEVSVGSTQASVKATVTSTTTTNENGEFTLYLKIGTFKVTFKNSAGEEVGSAVFTITSNDSSGVTLSDQNGVIVTYTVTSIDDGNTSITSEPFTALLGASGQLSRGQGITADSNGNIYITGYSNGNFDGQTLIGSFDAFLVKYNTTGNKQWTKLINVSGANTQGNGITTDSSGNVYITGQTTGNLDGETKTGNFDVFVTKYDSSGNRQWTRLLGSSGTNTLGKGITVDYGGNVYVTGEAWGDLDGQTKTGTTDVFVIKYDSSGTKQWTKLMGVASKNTVGRRIVADSTGNIYAMGSTEGGLDGQTLTGTKDVFVIKYDSSGNKQWTKLSGASNASSEGNGITADSSGNVYVTGSTGTLGTPGNFDGQTVTGIFDLFVFKYDSSGTKQWTKLMGVNGSSTYGRGVVTDSSGNIYLTGETNGNLDGQSVSFNGTTDVLQIKFDSSGTKQYTKLMGVGVTGKPTLGKDIAIDPNGLAYIVGDTDGNLDGQTITGFKDAFITSKLNE